MSLGQNGPNKSLITHSDHSIFLQRSLQYGVPHGISTFYACFSIIVNNCVFKCNKSLEEQPRPDFTRHTQMFTGKKDSMLVSYKIILKRKNHWNTMVQFYYIGADFLVLRGHMTFMKLVFTASDNVH